MSVLDDLLAGWGAFNVLFALWMLYPRRRDRHPAGGRARRDRDALHL